MYAQLDENDICKAVTEQAVAGVEAIPAAAENLGQRWDRETETWETIEIPKEAQIPEPTNTQIAHLITDLHAKMIAEGVLQA